MHAHTILIWICVLKHYYGMDNKTVDASNMRFYTLRSLSLTLTVFESYNSILLVKNGDIYTSLIQDPSSNAKGFDSFLFRGIIVYIPNTSLWNHLI